MAVIRLPSFLIPIVIEIKHPILWEVNPQLQPQVLQGWSSKALQSFHDESAFEATATVQGLRDQVAKDGVLKGCRDMGASESSGRPPKSAISPPFVVCVWAWESPVLNLDNANQCKAQPIAILVAGCSPTGEMDLVTWWLILLHGYLQGFKRACLANNEVVALLEVGALIQVDPQKFEATMVIGLVEGKLATGNPCLLPSNTIKYRAGWWFGTCFIFPYIGNNHPNWLIFFRGVGLNHQPDRVFLQNLRTCMACHKFKCHEVGRNGLWKVGFIWLIHVNTLQMAILYHGFYGFMGKKYDKHCINHGIFLGGNWWYTTGFFVFPKLYIYKTNPNEDQRFGSGVQKSIGC